VELVPAEYRPECRDRVWEDRPRGHHFCFALIQLFVLLVLRAPTTIRGASGALCFFVRMLPQSPDASPSANCGSNWLLRLGLYELSRPLEQADDWVWIVDHSIHVGNVKCLLIVGCRLSVWRSQKRQLTHQDLNVLALEPAETSKSDVVLAELEKVTSRTGVPRQILSDGASDLKRAIKDFQLQHVDTVNSYDIKHKIALILKRELEHDSSWSDFIQRATSVRSQLVHDPLTYLSPPTLRHKARYMNLAELVQWAQKVRRFLDQPIPPDDQPISLGKLNLTLGWLRQFDEPVARWASLLRTAEVILEYTRAEGYHDRAVEKLALRLVPVTTTLAAQRMAEALLPFIAQESAAAKPGERLLASSEVIESLIGKGKRLEARSGRAGFTKVALALAAAVVEPTPTFIDRAFQAIKTADVVRWVKQKLGMSLPAKRQAALNRSKPEQNLGQLALPFIN